MDEDASVRIRNAEGRQYHLGLAPGELGDAALLCGDVDRAQKVAERFDEVTVHRRVREFETFTGRFRGRRISAISTGIGPDNTEIAMIEMAQVATGPLVVIRVGSCGALQPEIECGDLVISTAAVRGENTSLAYVMPGFPAVASHEVVSALIEACRMRRAHVGITATMPGFYGWQGRDIPPFHPLDERLVERLARLGVLNMEMETSALLTLGHIAGWRCGSICAVYANRRRGTFISPEKKHTCEAEAIDAALEAVCILMPEAGETARGGSPSHPF